jgi:hypothetical protein
LGEKKIILLMSAWKKSSAFTADYGRFGKRFTPPLPLMKFRRSFYPASLITTRLQLRARLRGPVHLARLGLCFQVVL